MDRLTESLSSAVREVAAHGVDAVVECGKNVSLLEKIEPFEEKLGVPILTMSVVLYWHALRSNGILDSIGGSGKLMSQHSATS